MEYLHFIPKAQCSEALTLMFTWKKFPRGQLIYKKLNRVIFREDCAHLFPNYVITNGPFACSDHLFVLLNTEPAHQPRKGTNFKYQHSWAQYQDTHNIVKKNWKMGGRRTPMYRIKLDLKCWSKNTFENFESKLERNADKLLHVEKNVVQNPNIARLNNWHHRLIKQREKMYLFNQKYWGKLARKE
ncbi:hypothetical protein Cgig2_003175 [Carnegiea gigantea]|uniref:Uncharacterized protein n=1 Tax=Carnegiea gigantea TaxID=171969 RepID=A0A9Q1K3H7_9CARY|nr:hypothetical protein Cgig2_003175 [Carnegiea gigantea]